MKKLLALAFIFILAVVCLHSQANGKSEYDLYTQYCPAEPFDLANDAARNFQRKSGLNALARMVAEHQIKREIKKNAKGKFKVNVDSYSLSDAKQGKFKRFTVTGKKIVSSDVYISNLTARTACKFIHLDLDKNPVGLLEPMVIDFEADISENDLNKTLQTQTFKDYSLGVKRRMVKISFFEFSNARVSLKNNQLNLLVDVRTLMGKPFTANVISKLKIENNKIALEDLKFGSTNHKIEGRKMQYLVKIFDPISYMQKVLGEYNCKTLLKSVKIENEKIIIKGSVFLGKS